MYFHWFQLARALVLAVLDIIPPFSYYSDVCQELEICLILGIVFMSEMPVTISNQRLGPVGQYSSKQPRPRDVFHP